MSDKKVWNFWSRHYNALLAQRVSLAPTRAYVLQYLQEHSLLPGIAGLGSTGAGVTGAGSTGAGVTGAGSTSVGVTRAGVTRADVYKSSSITSQDDKSMHVSSSANEVWRVLDVGCGTGQLLALFDRHLDALPIHVSRELWGVDYANAMLEQAALAVPQARLLCLDAAQLSDLPAIAAVQAANETVPSCSNANNPPIRFDLIVCTHSLPYYPDASAALHAMFGLLKPGGVALIVHASAASWYDRFFLSLVKLSTGGGHYYRPDELCSLLPPTAEVLDLHMFKTAFWLSNFVFLAARKKG